MCYKKCRVLTAQDCALKIHVLEMPTLSENVKTFLREMSVENIWDISKKISKFDIDLIIEKDTKANMRNLHSKVRKCLKTKIIPSKSKLLNSRNEDEILKSIIYFRKLLGNPKHVGEIIRSHLPTVLETQGKLAKLNSVISFRLAG